MYEVRALIRARRKKKKRRVRIRNDVGTVGDDLYVLVM